MYAVGTNLMKAAEISWGYNDNLRYAHRREVDIVAMCCFLCFGGRTSQTLRPELWGDRGENYFHFIECTWDEHDAGCQDDQDLVASGLPHVFS